MAYPNLPGVPPLLNAPSVPASAAITASAVSNVADLLAPRWGVFRQSGAQAIVPDSFVDFEFLNATNIPTYPQEQGAFASYNKVQTPRSHTVTMSKGGTKKALADFLTTLESLAGSLELFTIVTPNRTYQRANIDRVEYRRSSFNGAGMIIASIHFLEIRQASAVFSQPGGISATSTVASAQAPVNNGQTYPTTAPAIAGGVM